MSTKAATLTIAATVSLVAFLLLFRDDTFRLLRQGYWYGGLLRRVLWNHFLDVIGDDPASLWSYGSWVVLMMTYWIVGGIYTYLDITNKPDAFRRYKVQTGANEPLRFEDLCKILKVVLFNQIVVTLPVSFFLGGLMIWRGTPPVRDLPPFHIVVSQIVVFILIEEVGFYYSHRLLHHRLLYKYIHKKHHEWTAPISIVALYSHPVEHIFSNLIPPFMGVFILNSHVSTAWLWFGLAIAFTLSEHSGYHLPFFPSSEAHDFHHFKFNNCYGVLGILDKLHGTDSEFRKSISYPRHRILKGFACARELFPDPLERKKSKDRGRTEEGK